MASFFNLRPGSLNNSPGDRNGCPVPGTLINTNNMRGFQDLDRELLLKAEAKKVHAWRGIFDSLLIPFTCLILICFHGGQILHDIMSGNVEENPALLLRFLVTSFADLKNWKVYYNVAFPSLVFNSRMALLSLHCASEVLSKEEVIIICA